MLSVSTVIFSSDLLAVASLAPLHSSIHLFLLSNLACPMKCEQQERQKVSGLRQSITSLITKLYPVS